MTESAVAELELIEGDTPGELRLSGQLTIYNVTRAQAEFGAIPPADLTSIDLSGI